MGGKFIFECPSSDSMTYCFAPDDGMVLVMTARSNRRRAEVPLKALGLCIVSWTRCSSFVKFVKEARVLVEGSESADTLEMKFVVGIPSTETEYETVEGSVGDGGGNNPYRDIAVPEFRCQSSHSGNVTQNRAYKNIQW